MPEELKPCPFCGGKAIVLGSECRWIVCRCCGAESRTGDTLDDAFALWNQRAPSPSPIADRLAEALRALTEKCEWMSNKMHGIDDHVDELCESARAAGRLLDGQTHDALPWGEKLKGQAKP